MNVNNRRVYKEDLTFFQWLNIYEFMTKKEFKKGILPLFDFWYFSSKKSTPSFFFSARQKTRAAKAARFFFISQ